MSGTNDDYLEGIAMGLGDLNQDDTYNILDMVIMIDNMFED